MTSASAQYTVKLGDSLWQLAKNRLGPNASNASIANAVHGYYTANAGVIGSNPNVIHPGQVLVLRT